MLLHPAENIIPSSNYKSPFQSNDSILITQISDLFQYPNYVSSAVQLKEILPASDVTQKHEFLPRMANISSRTSIYSL